MVSMAYKHQQNPWNNSFIRKCQLSSKLAIPYSTKRLPAPSTTTQSCHKSNQKQAVCSLIKHTWCCKAFHVNYFGGQRTSSRNSSILLMSVLTSPSKVRKGGCVPGASFCRSSGFLQRTQGQQGVTYKPKVAQSAQWAALSSPLEVNSCDVEDHSFEPEDHEETLGKRTVADAFSITSCLHTDTMHNKVSQAGELRLKLKPDI